MPTSPFLKLGATAALALLGSTLTANADSPLIVATPPIDGKTYVHSESFMVVPPVQGAAPQAGTSPGVAGQTPPRLAPAFNPPPPPPKPTAQDGQKLLEIERVYRVVKTPLNLTVEKATLEEIVAQIRKQLPAPSPQIEIRDAKPIRFSFALKNSTVKEALETAGSFAGVKLWSLPDRLLLAPETSLTKGDWGDTANLDTQRVFSSLLVDEITAKMKGQPQEPPAPPVGDFTPGPSFKLTFDQLSPEGKEMLQALVDQANAMEHEGNLHSLPGGLVGSWPDIVLSPTATVAVYLGATRNNLNGVSSDMVSVQSGNRGQSWSTDLGLGGSTLLEYGNAASGSAVAPVLDLSAKKS